MARNAGRAWHRLLTAKGYAPDTWTTHWKYTGSASDNPFGVAWYGIFAGLGFVLAFGYWCTNFLIVQRAMAAEFYDSGA